MKSSRVESDFWLTFINFIIRKKKKITSDKLQFNFKLSPSGIILSGNEISQILLSLILSYAGGQRNRPRWIAWGVVCCALSCFILVLPHFIYGPGEDALHLTQEFKDANVDISILLVS